MANAFDAYQRARAGAMQQGQNMLAMEQAVQKIQRDRELRNILSSAYRPEQAAIPAMPSAPAEGPLQPGAAPLPDYPAQAAVPAQAAGVDMENALAQMYKGGFGPEAMAIQQKQQQLAGATPSTVNEWKFFNALPAADQEKFLKMKRAQQIKKIGGVETVVSPLGGPTPLGTLEAETKAKAELKKGEVLGAESAKLAGEAFKESEKIDRNITNLSEVVRLVKEEGAETGPLAAKLPSFRASSIQLDNMRNRLGLDVIGAVTFGALSKGELDLALDTALPTKLEGPALIAWAENKIAAQNKLRNYLQEQAVYLSKQGSTQAGWVEQQKAKTANQGAAKSAPKPGTIQGGYVFMGGDPAKPESWKKQ